MSKIVIQVAGGLVQDVFIRGTGKPTAAIVVDEDVEGSEDYLSVKIGKNNKTYEAHVHSVDISELPNGSDVDKMVKAYENQ